MCLGYLFGRGFLSMVETVISSLGVLQFLSIYVYIPEESTNNELIPSAIFHCYLYRELVSMIVFKSQNLTFISVAS